MTQIVSAMNSSVVNTIRTKAGVIFYEVLVIGLAVNSDCRGVAGNYHALRPPL